MLNTIPEKILDRMRYLEECDRIDREDGTTKLQRLRQIPKESGKFISLMTMNTQDGEFIEIGTSAGYSALWIILAIIERDVKFTTFEILETKYKLAKESFRVTATQKYVNLVHGDFRDHIDTISEISFCFLDVEKEIYQECYDLIIPKMASGGIMIADNVISHQEELSLFIKFVEDDNRVDSIIVPIGKGLLYVRKS